MKDFLQLKPIRESPSDYDDIEKKIKEVFLREIYAPLIKEFYQPIKKLKNSRNDLIEAIQSGRLTFNRGKFSGKLNASLSRELRALGAKWDRMQKCYSIPLASLPMDMRNAISSSSWKFQDKISKIDEKLAAILPEQIADKLQLSNLFDKSIWKVEKEFRQSVKNITVAPVFTEQRRKDLAEKWQKNMGLWIKDFTQKEIKQLRSDLSKSVFAGNRYEDAVKSIQKSYGVTERKAKFLARQETSLAMTTYKYSRYQEAGVEYYRWTVASDNKDTSPNHHTPGNVRYSHAILDKKVFRFDAPPVTTNPGEPVRRNNPHQDYNCRCTAIPLARFK